MLKDDVHSARFAFEDYGKQGVLSNEQRERRFAHAKNFVCAVRRVGRMVAKIASGGDRGLFPNRETSRSLKAICRANREFFENYRIARDAIEHIDGQIGVSGNWGYLNLWHDSLEVVTGKAADVTESALQRTEQVCDQILGVVQAYIDSRATPEETAFIELVRGGWVTPAASPSTTVPPNNPIASFADIMRELDQSRADR
jgi:hypothetical protein